MSNSSSSSSHWGLLLLGASLAAGLVVATHLATRSLMYTKLVDQAVSVKGYAEKQIVSDRATWSATFSAESPQLVEANTHLSGHRDKVLALLDAQGAKGDAVTLGPVVIRSLFKKDEKGNDTNELERYRLEQRVEVSSQDVRLVDKVAKAATALIEQGVELRSERPQYIYTKLNDLKSDLLAQATRNACDRAKQIAGNSGSGVGQLRSAKQGVFQITPIYSTEVSDGGENDTTTIDKIVRAVVTVEFAVQ